MKSSEINFAIADLVIKKLTQHNFLFANTSPGLRNAPLLSALKKHLESKNATTSQNSSTLLKITSNFDERAAGHRALAQAKVSSAYSCLMCTSGTAAANYFPAIIESFLQEIPLLVITADRPTHAIQALSNQSINQNKLFQQYTPTTLNIITPSSLDYKELKDINRKLDTFLKETLSNSLPGHLNISFWDPANQFEHEQIPLVTQALNSSFENVSKSLDALSFGKDKRAFIPNNKEVPPPDLICVGELPLQHNAYYDFIKELLSLSISPFILDVTSQLKYEFMHHKLALPSFDHPEVLDKLKHLNIKNVWHFGKRFTSKNFYRHLSKSEVEIFDLGTTNFNFNPSFSYKKSLFFDGTQNSCNQILKDTMKKSSIVGTNTNLDFRDMIKSKQNIIESQELSFPYISKNFIEKNNKSDLYLVLANSTCIRSFDYFISLEKNITPYIYCHRGASGIEGQIAAIKGIDDAASNKDTPIVAFIGDISFLHDFNSLFLLQNITRPIRIFIINDNGGGIFRLLKVPEIEDSATEMITSHNLELEPIVQQIAKQRDNFSTTQINTKIQYTEILDQPFKNGIEIIEVLLDVEQNQNTYNKLRTIRTS